jgi:MFS family permease
LTNPYTPPGAPVKDPPGAPRRSSLAAIGVGFAVDVVATLVFSTILGIAAAAFFSSSGESLVEIADRIDRSPGLQLIGLAGGLGCTALGGYIAARFANHSEYANAFAVGVVSLLFGEITIQFAAVAPEWWLHLASAALVIPAALVGAHLRMQQKRVAAQ